MASIYEAAAAIPTSVGQLTPERAVARGREGRSSVTYDHRPSPSPFASRRVGLVRGGGKLRRMGSLDSATTTPLTPGTPTLWDAVPAAHGAAALLAPPTAHPAASARSLSASSAGRTRDTYTPIPRRNRSRSPMREEGEGGAATAASAAMPRAVASHASATAEETLKDTARKTYTPIPRRSRSPQMPSTDAGAAATRAAAPATTSTTAASLVDVTAVAAAAAATLAVGLNATVGVERKAETPRTAAAAAVVTEVEKGAGEDAGAEQLSPEVAAAGNCGGPVSTAVEDEVPSPADESGPAPAPPAATNDVTEAEGVSSAKPASTTTTAARPATTEGGSPLADGNGTRAASVAATAMEEEAIDNAVVPAAPSNPSAPKRAPTPPLLPSLLFLDDSGEEGEDGSRAVATLRKVTGQERTGTPKGDGDAVAPGMGLRRTSFSQSMASVGSGTTTLSGSAAVTTPTSTLTAVSVTLAERRAAAEAAARAAHAELRQQREDSARRRRVMVEEQDAQAAAARQAAIEADLARQREAVAAARAAEGDADSDGGASERTLAQTPRQSLALLDTGAPGEACRREGGGGAAGIDDGAEPPVATPPRRVPKGLRASVLGFPAPGGAVAVARGMPAGMAGGAQRGVPKARLSSGRKSSGAPAPAAASRGNLTARRTSAETAALYAAGARRRDSLSRSASYGCGRDDLAPPPVPQTARGGGGSSAQNRVPVSARQSKTPRARPTLPPAADLRTLLNVGGDRTASATPMSARRVQPRTPKAVPAAVTAAHPRRSSASGQWSKPPGRPLTARAP